MSKVLYLSNPDLTGTWEADSVSPEFKEDVSVFRFTIAEDDKTATYAVCEDTATCRQALAGMRRGWMSTACESEMFAPASTKAIKTAKVGVADLQEDGRWKVRNMAKIEFVE